MPGASAAPRRAPRAPGGRGRRRAARRSSARKSSASSFSNGPDPVAPMGAAYRRARGRVRPVGQPAAPSPRPGAPSAALRSGPHPLPPGRVDPRGRTCGLTSRKRADPLEAEQPRAAPRSPVFGWAMTARQTWMPSASTRRWPARRRGRGRPATVPPRVRRQVHRTSRGCRRTPAAGGRSRRTPSPTTRPPASATTTWSPGRVLATRSANRAGGCGSTSNVATECSTASL